MTTLFCKKTSPTTTPTPATDLRSTLTKLRTAIVDHFVIDKTTGEIFGSYTCSEYSPEPIDYSVAPLQERTVFVIDEDGSPFAMHSPVVNAGAPATVLSLPTVTAPSRPNTKTGRGRKAQGIDNGLCELMWAAKIEEVRLPWLDHYVRGAINAGPGVINGRYSVSPADVIRLLYLPKLSVESASSCLLNHDHEPMSVRQIQRVIEATRLSLRGIALYLERHPDALLPLDVKIDFNQFWQTNTSEEKKPPRAEHPKRQDALRLLKQGEAIKAIARQTGVSKTTLKKWRVELLAA